MQKKEVELVGFCVMCGKEVLLRNKRWVYPLCKKCKEKTELKITFL